MLCPRCGKEVGDFSRYCDNCEAEPAEEPVKLEQRAAGEKPPRAREKQENLIRVLVARFVSEQRLFLVGLGFFFSVVFLYFLLVAGELVFAAGCALLGTAAAGYAARLYVPEETFDIENVERLVKRLAGAGLLLLLLSAVL